MTRTYKAIIWFLICGSVLLTWLAFASAEVVTVRTDADIRKALTTTQPDITLVLAASIKVESTLTAPATLKHMRIVGERQTAGLDFEKLPIGNDCNGFELNCYTVDAWGFTVKNFQPSGTALKFNGPGAGTFGHITWDNIATTYVKPTTQPVDATGVHYGHCLTSHNTSQMVVVTGCAFRRCCWSSAEYSHCLYMHVPGIVVTDNTFDQCGGGTMELYGESVLSAGNVAKNGISTPTRTGAMIPPAFAYVPAGCTVVYLRNTLGGDWRAMFFGWPGADDLILGNKVEP